MIPCNVLYYVLHSTHSISTYIFVIIWSVLFFKFNFLKLVFDVLPHYIIRMLMQDCAWSISMADKQENKQANNGIICNIIIYGARQKKYVELWLVVVGIVRGMTIIRDLYFIR